MKQARDLEGARCLDGGHRWTVINVERKSTGLRVITRYMVCTVCDSAKAQSLSVQGKIIGVMYQLSASYAEAIAGFGENHERRQNYREAWLKDAASRAKKQ